MPGLSGIQLASKVKEVNPNVKVVLMTAFEIRDNEFSKYFLLLVLTALFKSPLALKI